MRRLAAWAALLLLTGCSRDVGRVYPWYWHAATAWMTGLAWLAAGCWLAQLVSLIRKKHYAEAVAMVAVTATGLAFLILVLER